MHTVLIIRLENVCVIPSIVFKPQADRGFTVVFIIFPNCLYAWTIPKLKIHKTYRAVVSHASVQKYTIIILSQLVLAFSKAIEPVYFSKQYNYNPITDMVEIGHHRLLNTSRLRENGRGRHLWIIFLHSVLVKTMIWHRSGDRPLF